MKAKGLIEDESTSTPAGRAVKDRVEELTDRLAAPPYDALSPEELDELIALLEPMAERINAAAD